MKNIFIILCACFLIGSEYVHCSLGALGIGKNGTSPLEKFNPKDVIDSAKDATIGIAKQIPQSIPTADSILSFSKNMIAGVPYQIGFELINQACKYFIIIYKTKLVDLATLIF